MSLRFKGKDNRIKNLRLHWALQTGEAQSREQILAFGSEGDLRGHSAGHCIFLVKHGLFRKLQLTLSIFAPANVCISLNANVNKTNTNKFMLVTPITFLWCKGNNHSLYALFSLLYDPIFIENKCNVFLTFIIQFYHLAAIFISWSLVYVV